MIVLDDGHGLPEGATVIVVCDDIESPANGPDSRRVDLPLVRSQHPGSLRLTSERLAEVLDEEDVSS
jgi:hypothetical protein